MKLIKNSRRLIQFDYNRAAKSLEVSGKDALPGVWWIATISAQGKGDGYTTKVVNENKEENEGVFRILFIIMVEKNV